MGDESVHERAELAVHRFGELMQSEIDAMVGDAILREIVRADLFGAIARLDLAAAFGSEELVLLLLLHFVKPGAENAHGLGAILDLRFFVLLRYDKAARNVRDTHGGVRGVHGLATRAGGTERVNSQVLRLDLDVNVVGFGEYGDRGGGGMDAALLLG